MRRGGYGETQSRGAGAALGAGTRDGGSEEGCGRGHGVGCQRRGVGICGVLHVSVLTDVGRALSARELLWSGWVRRAVSRGRLVTQGELESKRCDAGGPGGSGLGLGGVARTSSGSGRRVSRGRLHVALCVVPAGRVSCRQPKDLTDCSAVHATFRRQDEMACVGGRGRGRYDQVTWAAASHDGTRGRVQRREDAGGRAPWTGGAGNGRLAGLGS